MPRVKCQGVSIEFPFEPYDCQCDYMSKVIQCLQSSKNGVLESPTGTGKTLCLLCSTLAWRNAYVSQQELGRCLTAGGPGEGAPKATAPSEGEEFRQKLAAELQEGATGTWNEEAQQGLFVDRPRIIYASRTHSQLSQAIDQLKGTAYRPRIAVIGSREQLCIHPDVQKVESNSAKVHMCRSKVNGRTCHFYNNLEQKKADKVFHDTILDIEDLVQLGTKHKVCPYYMARELKTAADVVFMPYNYLLDSKSRRAHSIELQGNVVIFDEAHNIEKICEESASFDMTSFDLASCVEATDSLLKTSLENEESSTSFQAGPSGGDEEFDSKALAILKKIFLDLEGELDKLEPPEAGITKPGSFIYELFGKVHITYESKLELLQLMEKIVSHLTTSSTLLQNKSAGLQKFCDVVNVIFSKDRPGGVEAHNCYKVHLRSTPPKKEGRTDLWTSKNQPKTKKQGYTLSYWCFSPGFAMRDLVSQGVRTILLTSGTLAPLDSFKTELQIPFPVELENPHVIGRHQMTVSIVTRGPDSTVLNSSYRTRSDERYIMSLGNAIVNFSRLVPNGLLVFFPSYPVMNSCLEKWQEKGIQNRISQYKEVFVEPRGKTIFVETIDAFYEKINNPTLNGACFFAVCRGKVSEGLDFADINGRAVVITGLPYPPRMDPRVMLKMSYLDEMRRKNNSALSGQKWYSLQASRAVNQAIGRVIRHKEDFGAILLCDTRFANKDTVSQLPSWVRPYVKTYEQFGKCVRDLTCFFKETEKSMPKPKMKGHRSSAPVLIDQGQGSSTMSSTSSMASSVSTVKAKHVDSHVPSLKRNRDGSHVSESQLKIMYEDSRPKQPKKVKGLLNALASVEGNVGINSKAHDIPRDLNFQDGHQPLHQRTTSVRLPKKRVIVVKKNDPDPVKATETKSPTKRQTEDPKHTSLLLSAQEYIAEVKTALSRDLYRLFSATMMKYKKDEDFDALIETLEKLFLKDKSGYPLFRNFIRFTRPQHRGLFEAMCVEKTGQGSGYVKSSSDQKQLVAESRSDEGISNQNGKDNPSISGHAKTSRDVIPNPAKNGAKHRSGTSDRRASDNIIDISDEEPTAAEAR